MQCQICESQVSERALFCEVCGHRVRRAPLPEPAPVRASGPARPVATRSQPAPMPAPPPPQPMVQREEVVATIEARTELGDRLEPEVLDTFLDRIEAAMINRVDAQVDARLRGRGIRTKQKEKENPGLPVAICSLIFGIPISAITASNAGLGGLAIAWIGIAAVNIAVNLRKDEN
jgi:hypothetical protein